MSYETIAYEVTDNIATLTLNRPDRLNALNWTMMKEMVDAFARVDADDAVRAVIVTAAGKVFCSGADLEAGANAFDAGTLADSPVRPDGSLDYSKASARDGGGILTLRIFRCLKPIIAAINGSAVGIGITMTLPMDIRLVSQDARIGFVFSRIGLVPEAASCYFLPRIVGISQALEWCYSGRLFTAEEAKAGGLVKAVLPGEEVVPAARALAQDIVDKASPVSVALIRQMFWRGLGMHDPMQAHQIDSRGILARGRSADVSEGVQAFLEKRPARFSEKVTSDMPDYFPWWEEPTYS